MTSLTITHNVTGAILHYDTCIYDSGSTLNMCSSDWVNRHGLTIESANAIQLHTSDGHTATTLGTVSSPIHFTFCKGHEYEHNFTMQLHVVPCSARVYDLLLGVPFINGNATWVDVPTSELVYRPWYMALQDVSTMHRIPIMTTLPSMALL